MRKLLTAPSMAGPDDWLRLGLGVALVYAGPATALPTLRPAASL